MMRDDGVPTSVKTDSGSPVHLSDRPCSACGCYQAFAFECGCGAVHSDVCYNCGGFVDVAHDSIEVQNEGIESPRAGRCRAGRAEHTHTWPFTEVRDRV